MPTKTSSNKHAARNSPTLSVNVSPPNAHKEKNVSVAKFIQREYLHPRKMQTEIERLSKALEDLNNQAKSRSKRLLLMQRKRELVRQESHRIKTDIHIVLQVLKESAAEARSRQQNGQVLPMAAKDEGGNLDLDDAIIPADPHAEPKIDLEKLNQHALDDYVEQAFFKMFDGNDTEQLPSTADVFSPTSTRMMTRDAFCADQAVVICDDNRPRAELQALLDPNDSTLALYRKYNEM